MDAVCILKGQVSLRRKIPFIPKVREKSRKRMKSTLRPLTLKPLPEGL